jgi:hypothetical protein
MKECRDCMVRKPITEYYKHYNTRDKLSPNCKECVRAEMRKRYKKENGGKPIRKYTRKA